MKSIFFSVIALAISFGFVSPGMADSKLVLGAEAEKMVAATRLTPLFGLPAQQAIDSVILDPRLAYHPAYFFYRDYGTNVTLVEGYVSDNFSPRLEVTWNASKKPGEAIKANRLVIKLLDQIGSVGRPQPLEGAAALKLISEFQKDALLGESLKMFESILGKASKIYVGSSPEKVSALTAPRIVYAKSYPVNPAIGAYDLSLSVTGTRSLAFSGKMPT
jgi:hypothetical protein